MKTCLLLFAFNVLYVLNYGQISYYQYFTDERLRIEYCIFGNWQDAEIAISELYKEPVWSGNKKNLIDTFNFGHYKIEVFDSTGTTLLYSKGFSTLFQEWQHTPEAKTKKRAFKQWISIPFPKHTIKVVFYQRAKNGEFYSIFSDIISPLLHTIIEEKPNNFAVVDYFNNGTYSNKVDIAIVAEGYTLEQMDKFEKDAKRLTDKLFNVSPFKENKNLFNVRFVKSPSDEEGTDLPHKNIWKKTAVDTRFYTFQTDRYISVYNYDKLGKVLANVPYDQIIVLVNTKTYGGGGIYNYYSIAVSDNFFADYVFIHEFGHAFAGLADEYDDADESNADFYDLKVEPWEPNITSLVAFEKKWKNMVDKQTPIPTPLNKKYEKKIGAFEGAGYNKKGMYRPTPTCIMRSLDKLEFCPVCQKAIHDIILFNTQP
ncbi:MAG: M64 family metallopeptidase [Bacteroidales bacterium]